MTRPGTIMVIGLCAVACWVGLWQLAVHWVLPFLAWLGKGWLW